MFLKRLSGKTLRDLRWEKDWLSKHPNAFPDVPWMLGVVDREMRREIPLVRKARLTAGAVGLGLAGAGLLGAKLMSKSKNNDNAIS